MNDRLRMTTLPILGAVVLWTMLGATPARSQALSYPALGNVEAAQGTIEMWVRLEAEPDGTQATGPTSFFFWRLFVPGREGYLAQLRYTIVWSPQVFHLFIQSSGKVDGKIMANSYIVTSEQWTGPGRPPLDGGPLAIPRLHQGQWHHIAVVWEGTPTTAVSLYLDGERVIPPVMLGVPIWDELDDMTFGLLESPIAIDNLRISSVARTPQEIKAAAAAGTVQADRFTLLLDRFDSLQKIDGVTWTQPQVMCHHNGLLGGRIISPAVESVAGREGQALRIGGALKGSQ